MYKKFRKNDIYINQTRAYPKVEFFLNSGSYYYNRTVENRLARNNGHVHLGDMFGGFPEDYQFVQNFGYNQYYIEVGQTASISVNNSTGWTNYALQGVYPIGLSVNSGSGIISGGLGVEDLLSGSGSQIGIHTIYVSAENTIEGTTYTASFFLNVTGTAIEQPTTRITMDTFHTSGSTIFDLPGGYDGTITGSPVTSSGIDSASLSFASGDYIDLPETNDHKDKSSTWSAWVKTDSTASYHEFVSLHNTSSNSDSGIAMYLEAGIPKVAAIDSTGSYVPLLIGSSAINDNDWHIVTFAVVENSASYLYVDGLEVDSDTAGTWTYASRGLRIAGQTTTTSSVTEYSGSLDDFNLFGSQLNLYEAATLKWLGERGTSLAYWVRGEPPVAPTYPDYTILTGEASSITASVAATDPEGASIRYFAYSGLPSGSSLNSSNGTISYTPSATGSHDIRIAVTDGMNMTISDQFTVTVLEGANILSTENSDNINTEAGDNIILET